MVTPTTLLRWIVLLPAAGALFHLFLGHRRHAAVSLVGPGVLLGAFGVALAGALEVFGGHGSVLRDHAFTWIAAGPLQIEAALRLDALSAVMALIITGIGFLIHVYSVGYMHGDHGFARYFAYLNLFVTAMLILVLGESLPVLFVGWEGVGLCSYLLIGFWYETDANAQAGKKAFIVNRIGDAGVLVGFALLFVTVGTLDVPGIEAHADTLRTATVGGWPVPVVVGLCLLLGATGKSAQVPLYVWLPDAMAGPTPVSALIHAATMVTAGIYMIARLHVVYAMAPMALEVVAVVGAVTALLAAVIATAQTDIKKVLAYSTVSQLGFMFLGLGVGAPAAAIFHVMTHAFFKALLFLGAGSVIHAMSGEQDMRQMGGLRGKLPITFGTMAVATLAIAGIPPLSGFFSKDEIVWAAFAGPHAQPILGVAAYVAAFLTAFYMGRLVLMTFFGRCRASHDVQHHLHESPALMTIPLMVLAVLSAVGGFIPVPHLLEPVLGHEHIPHAPLWFMALATGIGAAGLGLAWIGYVAQPALPGRIFDALGTFARLVQDKFRIDELYASIVVRPVFAIADAAAAWFDPGVVDGAVNGGAGLVAALGAAGRRLQTGNLQHYALSVLIGALGLVAWWVGR